MNAHASEHAGPVNYGDAFASLCRSDGALLARRATTNYNKVVFARDQLADLKSGMPAVEVAIGLGTALTQRIKNVRKSCLRKGTLFAYWDCESAS